jgi:hypothetical protein
MGLGEAVKCLDKSVGSLRVIGVIGVIDFKRLPIRVRSILFLSTRFSPSYGIMLISASLFLCGLLWM